jgi:hypothetical protein
MVATVTVKRYHAWPLYGEGATACTSISISSNKQNVFYDENGYGHPS